MMWAWSLERGTAREKAKKARKCLRRDAGDSVDTQLQHPAQELATDVRSALEQERRDRWLLMIKSDA